MKRSPYRLFIISILVLSMLILSTGLAIKNTRNIKKDFLSSTDEIGGSLICTENSASEKSNIRRPGNGENIISFSRRRVGSSLRPAGEYELLILLADLLFSFSCIGLLLFDNDRIFRWHIISYIHYSDGEKSPLYLY